MKKLLIFMLVLGMASLAQADLVGLSFSVTMPDGTYYEDQPDEIWIEPSDTIKLDLLLDVGHNCWGYSLGYGLSNAQAEFIRTNETIWPAPFELPGGWSIPCTPQYVEFSGGQLFGNALNGPQTLMDRLYIHCLEATDVVLTVTAYDYTEVDGESILGIIHTLTIHQIPEPATMLLLGLGGLFLRRRK